MYPIVSENETLKMVEELVRMEDGIGLYTRYVCPKKEKKYPIVYIRTPYEEGHDGVAHELTQYEDDVFIQNEYAVVLQHCRGRGDSEGVCIPYNETKDGLETLEYIRRLPFYNGEIYVKGGSYLSTVHLSYIGTNPSDIKAAALAIQTDRMYFRNYRNGCNYHFCNVNWYLSMINRQYPEPKTEEILKRPYKDIMKRVVGEDVEQYTAFLMNDTYNDFWINDPRTTSMEELQIPVLLTEGWYDYYIDGMFSMWQRMSPETKEKSAFIVGPWGHSVHLSSQAQYPLKNGALKEDYVVEWFNSIRYGKAYPYAEKNKVNYYSIGGGFWTNADYPQKPQSVYRMYFNSEDRLTTMPLKSETEDIGISYVYDPDVRLDCFPYRTIYKAFKMNTVDGVISFLSEEFTEEKEFFGEIRWRLNVSSDCEDTAFFMRVYFVEDDESYNLTETITSLSYLYKEYTPGEKVTIDIKTPPIAFTVKAGMRIRVDIASDGGVYVPHANVKGHWAEVTECKTANNTIYLRDSFIELPEIVSPQRLDQPQQQIQQKK